MAIRSNRDHPSPPGSLGGRPTHAAPPLRGARAARARLVAREAPQGAESPMPVASSTSKAPRATTPAVGPLRPLLSAVVLRSQTDERLVALARDGHDQAFVAIAHRYRRELMAHARRGAPTDRAEDIVQQAMLSAWSALTHRADVLDVRAWLHRIVHNAALRLAQRGDQHDELSEALAGASRTDTMVELRLDARDALTALAGLPDAQRRALELTALGGSSGRDAAAALGVSEGALRKLLHRARATLRTGVAALIPPPLLTWSLGGGGSPAAAHITELGAGAGLATAAIKVGTTVAVTASIIGGTSQLLPNGHHHHIQPRHGQAAAPGRSVARQAGGEGSFAGRALEPSTNPVRLAAWGNGRRQATAGGASGSQHGQSGPNAGPNGQGQSGTIHQRDVGSHDDGSRGGKPTAAERSAPEGVGGSAGLTGSSESATGHSGASEQTGDRGAAVLQGGDQGASQTAP
jgi:RNA polymerase sigma factor (sigma-70 family)